MHCVTDFFKIITLRFVTLVMTRCMSCGASTGGTTGDLSSELNLPMFSSSFTLSQMGSFECSSTRSQT